VVQNQFEILDGIGKIYEAAKDYKLEEFFFENNDDELERLLLYLKTSKSQDIF
jgi:hypothetical protein